MHRVVKVKYMHDFLVELTFKKGEVRVADLASFVGGEGVFKPLLDVQYFRQVKINDVGNTIEWPNGADVAPEVLWEMSDPKKHAV